MVAFVCLPATAHADNTPGYVTPHEYHRAHVNMTRHKVTHIFGVRGHDKAAVWDHGRLYIVVVYPYHGHNGIVAKAVVVFLDPCTCGGRLLLDRKYLTS
jgi:hypothetical protein